jgi:single-strand DNA-binding protein
VSSYQQVTIVGNLGKDPEVRYTTGGDPVANFSVAVSESYTSKATGEKVEKTVWFNVVAWKKLGEICGEYLTKGSKVLISGKIDTSDYTDKDGVKRYKWELRANEMKMLDGKKDRESGDHETGAERADRKAGSPQEQRKAGGSFDDMDDDIPF